MQLDRFNLQDDAPRMEQTQKKQVEYTLIGSQRRVVGHTLFQYNPETGEITAARIIRSNTIDYMTLKPLHNPRVDVQKGCIYLQALNKKNVIKRLRKQGYSKNSPNVTSFQKRATPRKGCRSYCVSTFRS